ncbi:inactive transglutaminase family protein [Alloalcanivorax mobilis]|uniref:inactive transglutaminase family protein n=1 Tax=Alloalcanivorax mobilis TaxID=2019569 RepID=UPI000C78F506|nr:inactive transglutaminase family protein [Alloalcanivorax mobilis]
MRSVKLHARLLATTLLIVGIGSMAYQVLVQKVPLKESETDPVWVVDAQVSFTARPNQPLKARMFVPPLDSGFTALNESFISNNYGVNVNRENGNRLVTWSARRGAGEETLYYRLMLTPRFAEPAPPPEGGPQFRPSPSLQGAERVAADALLAPIRQHSADIETFISETIKRVNNLENDNVRLLLGGDLRPENRARVVDLLLAVAHIPAEPVHTLQLADNKSQQPELWLRTFNGQDWLYFNPLDGRQGLPEDRLVWWSGEKPLLTLEGGRGSRVSFSVHENEMSALQLAQSLKLQDRNTFIDFTFYELPVPTQQLLKVLIMIPVGVLLVLLIRSLVGMETLGTFTPVLIALAFRETQVIWGVLLFTGITTVGLSVRSYLEHLKLQLLARLSVVLTFVVIMMGVITLLSYKLGLSTGLSVALFPMVILTMVIERVSIVWEERGGPQSLKVAIGTLIAAVLCHFLMVWEQLIYLVFTFPGILLMLAAVMVVMGHYRGYRLMELLRFRAMTEEGN